MEHVAGLAGLVLKMAAVIPIVGGIFAAHGYPARPHHARSYGCSAALSDPDPLVRGHAVWALGKIGSAASIAALEGLQPSEADPFVQMELYEVLCR